MYPRFNKLISAATLTALLLWGCAAQRDVSRGGGANATDSRPCIANFSMEGSFWSGRTVKSFQEYPNSSKVPAFAYLVTKLASIGYKINSSDKDVGLVSASYEVGFGQGATTNMNAMVTEHNPTGVRVDLTFTAAGGVAFGLDDIHKEFCSILEGVPPLKK